MSLYNVILSYCTKVVYFYISCVSALAKDKGRFKEAQTILEDLKNASGLTIELKTKIQILDAQLAWFMDNKLIAKHILHKLGKSDDVDPK